MPKRVKSQSSKGEAVAEAPEPKKGKGSVKPAAPSVIYSEVAVELCLGDSALTAERARELLGWEEISAEDGTTHLPLLRDMEGTAVRCAYNQRNRPLLQPVYQQYCQDLLNRRWADSRNGREWTINGETVVIGRHGSVLSGQHRLIALVLAHQLWEGKGDRGKREKHHWRQLWKSTPPTMECVLVTGVSESPEVVRTLDNGRPRTDADVLFTSPYFRANKLNSRGEDTGQPYGPRERQALCKMAEFAVRLLWERTGAKKDSYSPVQTRSETVDFLTRHPRVEECVLRIYEEDKQQGISYYCPPGTAAGLLYLMGSCASDGDLYRNMPTPAERSKRGVHLDWRHWEKALEFWTQLSQVNLGDDVPPVKNTKQAMRPISPNWRGSEDYKGEIFAPGSLGGSASERVAVICKAWNAYLDHGTVHPTDVILDYRPSPRDGFPVLNDPVNVGGIDLGPGWKRREDTPTESSSPSRNGPDDTSGVALNGQQDVEADPGEEELPAEEQEQEALAQESAEQRTDTLLGNQLSLTLPTVPEPLYQSLTAVLDREDDPPEELQREIQERVQRVKEESLARKRKGKQKPALCNDGASE